MLHISLKFSDMAHVNMRLEF